MRFDMTMPLLNGKRHSVDITMHMALNKYLLRLALAVSHNIQNKNLGLIAATSVG